MPAANRPRCAAPHAAAGGLIYLGFPTTRTAMKIDADEHDPNAELHSFEPLRVSLALGALLLGLLLGIH